MILTCIFIVMVLLGFILMKINISWDYDDYVNTAGLILVVPGAVCLISSFIIIIGAYTTANNDIQKNKIQYEGLCKRYEIVKSEYEDVSKSDVIADITAWNTYVYDTKYWTKNPWTSWFNPKRIADNMEYIPLE